MKPVGVVAVLLAVCATLVFPQTKQARLTPEYQLAVNVLRVVNTAEVAYRRDSGHFGTLQQLGPALMRMREGRKGAASEVLQRLSPDAVEPLPGWALNVVVGEDGKHYAVSVRNSVYCDVNAFSDDNAIIYTGTAIGCEKTITSAAK